MIFVYFFAIINSIIIIHFFYNIFKGISVNNAIVCIMKRLLSLLITFILIFSPVFIFPSSANYNSELKTEADIVLLFSLDDGTVIFDKNSDKKNAMASLTKIITAAVVIENCENLDEKIVVPEYCLSLLKGTKSAPAVLKEGEELTVRQLLYCLMVKSANEAAYILADFIGNGSIESFVAKMNEFAKSIGCKNTHFVNPHGLDEENQYTTANDMALIVKHALDLPSFMDICNTNRYTLEKTNKSDERNFYNSNWLINSNYPTYYYKYVQSIKAGTTEQAGCCVVSKASKDGYNYCCIIMNAPSKDINGDGKNDNLAFTESKRLYKWAFENLRLEKIADVSQIVTVVDVKLSFDADHVRLVPANDVSAIVPVGNDENSVLIEAIENDTPKQINAPVKKGEVIGKANILYAGNVIATVDLVAAEDVKVNMFLWLLHAVKVVVTSPVFLVFLAIALIAGISYHYLLRKQKDKKMKRSLGRTRPVMYAGAKNLKKSKSDRANNNNKTKNSNNKKR